MSISTKRGDKGKTDLIGRVRVSKADLRVECYGNLDELNAQLGLARSLCTDSQVHDGVKQIQRDLFIISAAVATSDSRIPPPSISSDLVERLDDQVCSIEKTEGILSDWAVPGERSDTAALDLARTVCRRAERSAVRLSDEAQLDPGVLVYLNRLSDLLWLYGRLIEVRAGVEAALNPERKKPKKQHRDL